MSSADPAVTPAARWADDHVVLRLRVGALGYYRYVPFDLPAGVRRIDIRVRTSPAALVGVGLFDPRGPGYQSEGFRGIAGAERSHVHLGVDDATPGFLAGPLPAGRWTLVVPVFAAWPGTGVRVLVSWRDGAAVPQRSARPHAADVVSPGPGWYRGDLHCHTVASSDAWGTGAPLTVADWITAARDRGLDFVTMTDHNTVSQNRAPIAGGGNVLVLSGEEMTNWFHGHALVVGLASPEAWVDWRQRPLLLPLGAHERRIRDMIAAVRGRGAFVAAAHPYVGLRSWQFMLDGVVHPGTSLPDGLEVWNGRFTSADRIALRGWDTLLRWGRRLTAVGGSDLHRSDDPDVAPGTPTTIVGAQALSRGAVVAALRAGRATLSTHPGGPELYVEATGPHGQLGGVGDTFHGTDSDRVRMRVHARRAARATLVAIRDGRRRTVARELAGDRTIELEQAIGTGGAVRFELRGRGWLPPVVALTNPVYLRNGRPPDPPPLAEPPPPPPTR